MKIGAITVGQSPRTDVTADIFPIWGDKAELVEAGALDGMTFEDIQKFAPSEGDHVLVSRMTDGTQVTFAEKYLGDLLQACIDRLEKQNVEIILFFCTGQFDFSFRSNVPIVYPSDILMRLVPILAKGQLIVITPSKLQLSHIEKKWLSCVPSVFVTYASPYGDPSELDRAIEEIKAQEGSLVVMDCIGYTQKMKNAVAAKTGKQVILSRTLLARVTDELADTEK